MAIALDVIEQSVREGMLGREYDGSRVVDAIVRPSTNPDVESDVVVVEVKLSASGQESWTPRASEAIRDYARELAARTGEGSGAVTVVLVPEHPDYGDDD